MFMSLDVLVTRLVSVSPFRMTQSWRIYHPYGVIPCDACVYKYVK